MRKPLEFEKDKESPPVPRQAADAPGAALAACSAELCHLEFDQEGEPDDEAYAELHRARRDDQVMQCEPKAKVPHPGVYVPPNPICKAADTERGAA
ncbi:MAG: hypothetical protein LUE17_06385 [Planctomycetaceae bacterium]|nr:hypothetical protein [Planctomycetaceae bacterium]